MDFSTPGLPVLHHQPELAQTHLHRVGAAIQASHPLSSPSPPAFNLSQNQGLFQWEGSSHQCGQSIGVSVSASDLSVNIQDWFPLGWTGSISLQSKGLLRVFSNTTGQKHQFFGAQFLYSPTLTSIHDHWKTIALTRHAFVGQEVEKVRHEEWTRFETALCVKCVHPSHCMFAHFHITLLSFSLNITLSRKLRH